MSADNEQRRLAAIMFTDMVGYSAMAQRDDQLALALLEEHRRLLREIFPRFHGTEIKTIGDAFLVEFGSALEAAQCAIEIQRTLAKRNHDVTSDRRIELKIGIHIGDVVHREGDVYGDGVNIASRIEQLAGAGGICVSMDVERQIRNALEARFEKFGSAELKNIKLPMELFRIVLPWETGTKVERGTTQSLSKKSSLLVTAAAVVLVGLLFAWWLIHRSSQNSQPTSTTRADAVPASPPKPPDSKSVAVLAFANLSDDKGAEYFSDGISEELLTVLQKVPGLHVAARTSAFSFKGKNATAQDIGQKLGVAHLVEGSVRKAGDSVRIAARLTRADTGEQLWSENYTRDLKDVFAVQTELAQTIVEQLRGQLTGSAADPAAKAAIQAQVRAAEKGGTKNVDAHQHYLQGRFYANRYSEKSAGEALTEYQRAVELDPSFALAWAGLAQTHVWFCNYSTQGLAAFDAHLVQAREATARALAIEPNLPEALRVRAEIQLNFDFDWKGAGETLRSALALAPADPALLTDAGTLAIAKGDMARGISLYRQAVALDPVNPRARSYLATTLVPAGQFADAQVEYARLVELSPASPNAHAGLGNGLLLQGKFEEAVTAAKDDAADWARLLVVAMARWRQKRIPESDAALARLIETSADTAAYQIAEVYAYREEKDRAFEWLERARRQRDSGLIGLRSDPFFANLKGDPRWDAFVRTMGLADDQLK
jgi:TolB-like protein/class 3 adenylate cyclase/Flp pilus assembly protein TadD